MKRILLETLCALAILVFLASLHGRVSSLKENSREVAELRGLVSTTAQNLEALQRLHSARLAAVDHLEQEIAELEKKVVAAAYDSEETRKLRDDLGATRREAALVKAQLDRDISRTQATVDAYQKEMRSMIRSDNVSLEQTRNDIALLALNIRRDPRTLSEELLSPAVQLNGDDTVGSGTIIFSGQNPKSKKVETYVITSYHVVRNILADTGSAKRDGIAVTIYDNQNQDTEELRCDMVAHDATIDTALLLIRSEKKFKNVARVISKANAEQIRVWDPVYAIGCPLGNDPIPSQGAVSSLRNELNGANYWMINAPTYFGNSGGGVYLARTRELAGVFSKIYTHGRGNPVVIPHMGLFTPMPAIHVWLEKAGLTFVLDNSTAPPREPIRSIDHLAAPPR